MSAHLANSIIKKSDELFKTARLNGSSNRQSMIDVHTAASKLAEQSKSVNWDFLDNYTSDRLFRAAQSWQSFAYRYDFPAIDFFIPEIASDKIPDAPPRKKFYRGVVVKISGNKTANVQMGSQKAHPKYGKIVRRTRKVLVHDEFNQLKIGDTVLIEETRPLSKSKRHALVAFTS